VTIASTAPQGSSRRLRLPTRSRPAQGHLKNGYDEQIFIRGDKGIDYGTVMRVMGRIKTAGFTKVSLVTESEGS
jgi:biopolymer transport protein ExbD